MDNNSGKRLSGEDETSPDRVVEYEIRAKVAKTELEAEKQKAKNAKASRRVEQRSGKTRLLSKLSWKTKAVVFGVAAVIVILAVAFGPGLFAPLNKGKTLGLNCILNATPRGDQ